MPIAPIFEVSDFYVEQDVRELPEEERTVFRIQPLTYTQREDVERTDWKHVKGEIVLVSDQLRLARKTLNYGLVGWERFKDASGNPIIFARETTGSKDIAPHCLDAVAAWAVEIANAIGALSRVSEAEQKNSSSR